MLKCICSLNSYHALEKHGLYGERDRHTSEVDEVGREKETPTSGTAVERGRLPV